LLNIADLLAEWLRSMQTGRVWLVGHDIGGGVAQLLATRHPDVVEQLTLTNCIVEDSWPEKNITRLRQLARLGLYPLIARMGLVASRRSKKVLQSTFGEGRQLDEQRLQRTFFDAKVASSDGRRAFSHHLAALNPSELLENSPQLKSLQMRTQVLWADKDKFQPWEPIGNRLVELLPEPTVSHLTDAGHFSPLEKPEAFTDALISFHSSRQETSQ
jgi:pimeloyl-ACP methyl ester carboxylesterase